MKNTRTFFSLLLVAFVLCGCSKFAQRPPAPWTDYKLNYVIHDTAGGGGSAMEVYKGSEARGSMGGGGGGGADEYFRVAGILPTGVQLEMDIGGTWSSAAFHVKQTLFVPYKGTTTLPITKDLTLDLNFIPH